MSARGEADHRGEGSGDLLDRGIDAIVSHPAPAGLCEAAIARAASWSGAEVRRGHRRSGRRLAVGLALAAGLSGLLVGAFLINRTGGQGGQEVVEDVGVVRIAMGDRDGEDTSSIRAFQRYPVYSCLVAESVPIIVATNGRAGSMRLGEIASYRGYGSAVRVWDWSDSIESRAVAIPGLDAEAVWRLTNQDAALSPDGMRVLWKNGQLLDLKTGGRRPIDLGEESEGREIGDLQFSPDGERVALLVATRIEGAAAPAIAAEIVGLSGGKRACEFPVQAPEFRLRAMFSPNGWRIACVDPDGRLVLRDAETGDVLRRYDPPLGKPVASVAISPDTRLIAASEDVGDLLVWDAESGRPACRIPARAEEPLRLDPTIHHLRFSPDGSKIAGADQLRVRVYDAASGREVVALESPGVGWLRWSADGERLVAITAVSLRRGSGRAYDRDRLPSVREWDWRGGKLVRELGVPEPPTANAR